MKRYIPTWPVAALLIAVPMTIIFFSQGVSRGFSPADPPWCQMNEEQNIWEVHQIENYEIIHTEEGGCVSPYKDDYDVRYDDKGIVGTCPWRQTCGEVWKLKSVDTSDAQLAAALRYGKDVVEKNTFLIGPEDYKKAEGHAYADLVQGSTEQGITATFEHWIGCRTSDSTKLSTKRTICLDGHVFRTRYDYNIPEKYDVTCTCNGDVIDWEGFSLCIDFNCPEDTAPEDGAGICPNIDKEPVIDGDDDLVEGEQAG